ncbi:MAG: AAA family ATPase [Alphaproteobacteria bacterium]|nr:AAA family ATPase [Alphaproteobacteria bacterium]
MLERIESIQGVGLLYQANGKPHKLEKATLVYADNGRGKSTLATVLRSAAINDPLLIEASKTVDGTSAPEVVLQFGNGYKVTFQSGAWSEARSELLVFDADFIGRNVHSGGEVSTDHRRHLLEFALGEAAVAARQKVEEATAASREAAQAVQHAERELSGFHGGVTLAQFERLPRVLDADKQTTDLQKRITAAKSVAAIQAKLAPEAISEPEFNIEEVFAKLALSVANVHKEAEARVKQHIAKLGGRGAETWLSQGRQFGGGATCPYCNQDTSGSDLVRSYQAHFDAAYADLKDKIAVLAENTARSYAPSIIDGVSQAARVASARCSAWSDYVLLPPIVFQREEANAALTSFRELISGLLNCKQLTPAESVGSPEDKAKAAQLWERVVAPIRMLNASIKAANDAINKYKTQLNSESTEQLQARLQQVQLGTSRYEPKVVDLLNQLAGARTNLTVADEAKKTAREKLDQLMEVTLSKYQGSINSLLKKFGAMFSIEGMSANFRGNAPRAEYGLCMRGKSIPVESGMPPFAKALSEGDKRTLAFAFFIACAISDPKLTDRVVVIDDPMCSLDRNRRHHTIAVLRRVGSLAAQLIVLAHDAYFLRDLRDAMRKDDNARPIGILQLVAIANGYTGFAPIDIDVECESLYAKHHRMLYGIASGQGGDPVAVAKAIRPLLEGYLYRRFPGLLPTDLLFGQLIRLIRDATGSNPLCYAKNLVDELTEINDYAGQFHHDTNPDADTVAISATELKSYVDRALIVVHKGTPP